MLGDVLVLLLLVERLLLLLGHHRVLGGEEVLDGLDEVAVAALQDQLQHGAALVRVESLQDLQRREATWAVGCGLRCAVLLTLT